MKVLVVRVARLIGSGLPRSLVDRRHPVVGTDEPSEHYAVPLQLNCLRRLVAATTGHNPGAALRRIQHHPSDQ